MRTALSKLPIQCFALVLAALPGVAMAQAESDAGPVFELKGRVFVRGAYERITRLDSLGTETSVKSLDLSVPQARVGIDYDIYDWLRLNIEVDFGGRVTLKDAFIQAKSKQLMTRAGQFKMPISLIAMESPWVLPLARRGLIHDLLLEQLQVAGRRPGIIGQARWGGWLDPKITAGAFQASDWGARASLLEQQTTNAHSLVGRFSVTPGGVEVAAVGEWRAVRVLNDLVERFWVVGGDAKVDLEFGAYGLRGWLEGLVGDSWLDEAPLDGMIDRVQFLTARGLVAFRRGGLSRHEAYGEVFAMYGFLDPNRGVSPDLVWEMIAGLNVGTWRHARLTVQLELAKAGRNARIFLLRAPPSVVSDHKAVVLQAGAAF